MSPNGNSMTLRFNGDCQLLLRYYGEILILCCLAEIEETVNGQYRPVLCVPNIYSTIEAHTPPPFRSGSVAVLT